MIFLVEYDLQKRHLVSMRCFADAQRTEAETARLERELQLHDQGTEREVVLLQAASEEELRRTHGRYFGDWSAILEAAVRGQ